MSKIISILVLLLIAAGFNASAQNLIGPKGTKVFVDTSKWTLNGANIYNKNTGTVGIGTAGAANSNAALEVKATDKGMLIPRIALTARNSASPLSGHVAGMLVYNTATAGTAPNNVTPGFYYNTGSTWMRIVAENAGVADTTNDSWKEDAANTQVKLAYQSNGSTARTSGTEFVIKDNGRVGIGTSSPSWMLDVQGPSAIGQFKRILTGTSDQSAGFLFTRARGNVGAETDILTNDIIGKIQFRGRLNGVDEDFSALMYKADALNPGQGHFGFAGSSLAKEVVSIRTDNGNMGVGTNYIFPLSRLGVDGYVKLGTSDSYADTMATAANRAGMIRYNSTGKTFQYHDDTQWRTLTSTNAADTTNDSWKEDAANSRVRLAYQSNGSTVRTAGTEFVINDNGNVGIGTAIPSDKLHVETTGNGNFQGIADFYAPSNNVSGHSSMLRLGVAGASKNSAELRYFYQNNNSDSNRFDISFYNLGTPVLSTLAGGRVGVNTSNPSATLEVNGTVEIATVNSVGNDINYQPLVWNTVTKRIETSGNNDNINKTIVNIASSASSPIYTVTGTGSSAHEVKIMVSNGCGASSYNKFVLVGSNFNSLWKLNFIGGMSANGVPIISRPDNSTVATTNPATACADGSDTTALNYTLAVDPATGALTITNNGNQTRTYNIIIEKIFD